jgi:hypothetical protein
MNALQLLRTDHQHLKQLLKDAEDTETTDGEEREKLLESIMTELKNHETIEEEIFYPALREKAEAEELVLEALEEHRVVDHILDELEDVPTGDDVWAAKLTVMKENIEHHVAEEEGEMFKQARASLSRTELEELGEEMNARKSELVEH